MFYPMARAKTGRAHLRARPLRAQPHTLWKLAKNDIFEASDMARSARGSARAPINGASHRIEHHQSNILCICNMIISLKVAEIERFEVSWIWTKNRKFLKNFKKIQNLGCKKFHFQFFTKLQDSVSLRVFKLWQWSNNEKVSIFIGEFEFHNFIGARALPRALRAI